MIIQSVMERLTQDPFCYIYVCLIVLGIGSRTRCKIVQSSTADEEQLVQVVFDQTAIPPSNTLTTHVR